MNDEMKSGRITGNPLGQRDPGRQAKGRDILIKKLKTVKDPSERDRILSSLSGRENLVTPETSRTQPLRGIPRETAAQQRPPSPFKAIGVLIAYVAPVFFFHHGTHLYLGVSVPALFGQANQRNHFPALNGHCLPGIRCDRMDQGPKNKQAPMKPIVGDIFAFYDAIQHGELQWIKKHLERMGVTIIASFLQNKPLILEFYRNYVEPYRQRVAICGINPGRFGSGKVGIPFLDFRTLSRLLAGVEMQGSEKSAQFFHSVVQYFGARTFYATFYVTNISWLGFMKGGRNVNYFELPLDIQAVILDRFTYEMDLLDPTHIISAARQVQKTLGELKRKGRIRADIEKRLNHPRWCGIDTNREAGWQQYIKDAEPLHQRRSGPQSRGPPLSRGPPAPPLTPCARDCENENQGFRNGAFLPSQTQLKKIRWISFTKGKKIW